MRLEITIKYADEKTEEKHMCSDFPSVNADFTTLYLENFGFKNGV